MLVSSLTGIPFYAFILPVMYISALYAADIEEKKFKRDFERKIDLPWVESTCPRGNRVKSTMQRKRWELANCDAERVPRGHPNHPFMSGRRIINNTHVQFGGW
jgi:hypothetical protein